MLPRQQADAEASFFFNDALSPDQKRVISMCLYRLDENHWV